MTGFAFNHMDCGRLFKLFLILVIFCSICNCVKAECFELENTNANTNEIDNNRFIRCNYERFSVIINCPLSLTLLSWAKAPIPDKGDLDTSSRNYQLDPDAAALNCQQSTANTYSTVVKGFDVGHLTPIDLLDDDINAALEANYMTNLLPQADFFNRNGAWRRTEILAECYRDETQYSGDINVFSGVIVGNDSSNDFFASSHGLVKTPDRFWKIIHARASKDRDGEYDAWIMSNSNNAKANTLDQSRVTLSALISVLVNDDSKLYLPVIRELMNEIPLSAERKKFSYNRRCHRMNG
ncbi:MAG TPA: hypothetical protein DG048_09865 [Pseudoalteromonas sp.]|nr:hypothetical protein [Pseudoalteromonas sp.]|tara:strand:+ start:59 stop:946 length:888 start_codon:yes stop_codon:yes gene_type:complete